MIDSLVMIAIYNSSSTVRAQMIGNARLYITNLQFINLLANIDINNPRTFNYSQLAAFDTLPGISEQVAKWIAAYRRTR
jgi:hypothetical protein